MSDVDEMVGDELVRAEQLQRWSPGRILFNQGEEPQGIFILHSGQVDLVFSGRNGTSKPLVAKRKNEIVGLSEAISQTRYDCTATVHSVSRIGFVPIAHLQKMLDENPSLWLMIAARLSVELSSCWESMRSLSAAR